jgi:prepilin-type N-terminal cleavage/methylation domain-containing protein
MNIEARSKARGFTLIELLVVIAIIGLLSSVILASVNTARARGRDAVRQQALTELRTAIEMYANDHNGVYPLGGGGSGAWSSQCSTWGGYAASSVITGLVPTYIPSMPADPSSDAVIADCIIYASNGTDYKLLDYDLLDTTNPGSVASIVDPKRNYNQSYPRPGLCLPSTSYTETTKTWAVYTQGYACY